MALLKFEEFITEGRDLFAPKVKGADLKRVKESEIKGKKIAILVGHKNIQKFKKEADKAGFEYALRGDSDYIGDRKEYANNQFYVSEEDSEKAYKIIDKYNL